MVKFFLFAVLFFCLQLCFCFAVIFSYLQLCFVILLLLRFTFAVVFSVCHSDCHLRTTRLEFSYSLGSHDLHITLQAVIILLFNT